MKIKQIRSSHPWALVGLISFNLVATAAVADVQVRDGDTIIVDGVPIRLNGIDAPELSTTEGQIARIWLLHYLTGKNVSCYLTGERTHDRYVGLCYVGTEDVGAAIISAGHALDCPQYSGGHYTMMETAGARSRISRASYC